MIFLDFSVVRLVRLVSGGSATSPRFVSMKVSPASGEVSKFEKLNAARLGDTTGVPARVKHLVKFSKMARK